MKAACALLLCLVAAAAAGLLGNYPYGHYPVYSHHGYFNNGYGHPGLDHDNTYFHFLGNYRGKCRGDYDYHFYNSGYRGEEGGDRFIVCDHGVAHRFDCPAGTVNGGDFAYNVKYAMHDICTVHA